MKIPSPNNISNTTLVLRIGLASVALCLACHARAQVEMPDTMQTPSVNGKDAKQRTSALNRADRQFLIKAGQAGITEITASNIALKKAHSQDVKNFAQQMVDDHTKVADKLKKLAADKGVTLATDLGDKNAAAIRKVEKLNGSAFDPVYTRTIGVEAHQDAVQLFKDASTKATDADVKSFATDTLPALEHHLQMAKELNAKTTK
jgi:putative membrane protein